MIKFTQVCSDHGRLYALGEDGNIYQIEHYTECDYKTKIEKHFTKAIQLKPFSSEPHIIVKNTDDIPF